MKFNEFLRLLHSYIGLECQKREFVFYLINLIMREPQSENEMKADKEEKYYPYSGNRNECDFLGRVYRGADKFPKEKAKQIKKYYDASSLLKELHSIPNTGDLSNALNRYGTQCAPSNAANICEEILHAFIDSLSLGIDEIDVSRFGALERTLSVYDDRELKMKYGVHLLTEVNNRCPYDGCFKSLVMEGENGSAFDYAIVKINPRITTDTVDNYIALCPECARKYMTNFNEGEMARLEDIKLQLDSVLTSINALGNSKLVDGVERVIRKISDIPAENSLELSYKPTQVINKMDRTNPALCTKITNYVGMFYPDVRDIFKNMEQEHIVDYERFCSQIKFKYKDIKELGLTQGQIFDNLVEWLASATHEEKSSCEVVVAFFVQKCEVFDVISR